MYHDGSAKFDDKQRRLNELYIDGTLLTESFQKQKEKLLRQRRTLADKLTFLETHAKNRFEPSIRFFRGLTKPQSVVIANVPRELCDFFKKVGSNFSIKDGLVMCSFRGPWKTVAAQRFWSARPRAGSKPVVSNFVPYEKFSAWSPHVDEDRTDGNVPVGAPSENRTMGFEDAIDQFFKDNPTWE